MSKQNFDNCLECAMCVLSKTHQPQTKREENIWSPRTIHNYKKSESDDNGSIDILCFVALMQTIPFGNVFPSRLECSNIHLLFYLLHFRFTTSQTKDIFFACTHTNSHYLIFKISFSLVHITVTLFDSFVHALDNSFKMRFFFRVEINMLNNIIGEKREIHRRRKKKMTIKTWSLSLKNCCLYTINIKQKSEQLFSSSRLHCTVRVYAA